MSISLEQARKAKKSLKEEFNGNTFHGIPVTGIGIGRDAASDYNVHIYTEKDLTSSQADKLPKERDGVKINYITTGLIRAGL